LKSSKASYSIKGAHSPTITARPSDNIIFKKLLCFDNELKNRTKKFGKELFNSFNLAYIKFKNSQDVF
jgi:hypothetical protein